MPPESPCRLPVKKRKVSTDTHKKNSAPWVAGLNCEYKLMLENNSWLCSEIINTCMNIIAQQFPHTAISGFQPTGLVPYFDEHAQYWTEQFGRFQRQDPPSVQIHHTGKSHWVTSLQDKKDGTVYVLDSYSKTFTLTPSLEIQLSATYGQGKTNLLIKLPEVQQQTNGYDCGVYALANLVEFCHSGTYNTQKTHTLH